MTVTLQIWEVLDKFHSFISENPCIEVLQVRGNSIMDNDRYGFSVEKEKYRYNFNNMSFLDISLGEPVLIAYMAAGKKSLLAGKRLDFHRDYILVHPYEESSTTYHKIYMESLEEINFRRPDRNEIETIKSESLLRKLLEK